MLFMGCLCNTPPGRICQRQRPSFDKEREGERTSSCAPCGIMLLRWLSALAEGMFGFAQRESPIERPLLGHPGAGSHNLLSLVRRERVSVLVGQTDSSANGNLLIGFIVNIHIVWPIVELVKPPGERGRRRLRNE